MYQERRRAERRTKMSNENTTLTVNVIDNFKQAIEALTDSQISEDVLFALVELKSSIGQKTLKGHELMAA